MKALLEKSLQKAINYREYRQLVERLILTTSTTGEWTQNRVNATRLNYTRMKRMEHLVDIPPEKKSIFQEVEDRQYWLLFAESFCDDAAQTLPVLKKLAGLSENIELKILIMNENRDLMKRLGKDQKTILQLLITDEALNVLAQWGPRSRMATQMVNEYQKLHGRVDNEIKKQLQVFYNKDLGKQIIAEIAAIEVQIEGEMALHH
ncbi:MAG: thioredoxin family protein [Christiangramia sp.]|nr:thioredoxin family protein [Christiangramia sp.]